MVKKGILIYSSLGIIVGGSVIGTATYFVVKRSEKSIKIIIDSFTKTSSTLFYDENGERVADPATTSSLKISNKKPILKFRLPKDSKVPIAAVDSLAKKFMTRGFHGPELLNLKSIDIDNNIILNNNILTPGRRVLGAFIPLTEEISINSSSFWNILNISASSGDTIKNDNIKNEILSEWLFQVLQHEYGHYVALKYPSSSTKKTSIVGVGDYADRWNANFLNDFKRTFTYDDDSKPLLPNAPTYNSHKSLGSEFSSKNMFDWANGLSVGTGDLNREDASYWLADTTVLENGNHTWSIRKTETSSLKYLYSMDELFTRKLSQATVTELNSIFVDAMKQAMDNLTEDFQTYATIYKVTPAQLGTLINTTPQASYYMSDYVFGATADTNRAENYVREIEKAIGEDTEANISFIGIDNQIRLAENPSLSSNPLVTSTVYQDFLAHPDNLKIGGFMPANKSYKYIGYMDGSEFQAFPIVTYPSNLGWKDALYSTTITPASSAKAYSTYTWISAGDIEDEKLYFSTNIDGSDKEAMTTIRDNEYGDASSFTDSHMPSSKKFTNYEATLEGSDIKIKSHGKWGDY